MFQVRRDDLKKIAEMDPANFERGVPEAREAAEQMAAMYANEDEHGRLYAVMTKIIVVDRFPELRVLSIYSAEGEEWSTNKYDAELGGFVSA